jgi:hypothetical protein
MAEAYHCAQNSSLKAPDQEDFHAQSLRGFVAQKITVKSAKSYLECHWRGQDGKKELILLSALGVGLFVLSNKKAG